MDPPPIPPTSPILNPLPPTTGRPIPSHIIRSQSSTHFLLAFKPNRAGIEEYHPVPIPKTTISTHHPHILKAWESKQTAQQLEASDIESKFQDFGERFLGPYIFAHFDAPRGQCSQRLLPGMLRHWGEVRICERHAPNITGVKTFGVCKGCRVAHCILRGDAEEMAVVMRRGARKNVCEGCAADGIRECVRRVARMCVCEEKWMCYECWEHDLKALIKVRDGIGEGRCGQCKREVECVESVEICGRCRRWRIYTNGNEEMKG